ncbi:MAG: hypothetical protein RLZZ68_658 [Bacteroidota bacterium]|jgi:hypothetical protein
MPNRIVGLFFLLLPLSFFGQEAEKAATSVLSYARNFTSTLCSPEYEGRGYVNHGCRKAGALIVDEFKRNGLLPYLGNYDQAFNLNVNTFPNQCKVKFGLRKLKPGRDYLVHPSSAGYKGVLSLKRMSAAEIMNYRMGTAPSKTAIAFVAGKVLSADSVKLVRSKLEKIAQTECAVVEYTREKLTWSVSKQRFKFPYITCFDTLQRRKDSKINVNIDNDFLSRYEVRNCFGWVPSVKPSDSIIVVSAHYDHLGRMGKKTYFPGANDNASGVAMLMSLARAIQQQPLQNHSVLFVAFAGEEIGLEGSFALVESGILDLKKISMVLNLDILGSGEEGITVVNGSVFPQFYHRLVQLNESIPAVPVVKPRGKAANSDHYPFSEKGVPSLFVYTMGPNKNYHDIHDRYENLSFDRFESLHYLFVRFLNRF